jgi:hypothetical protein
VTGTVLQPLASASKTNDAIKTENTLAFFMALTKQTAGKFQTGKSCAASRPISAA